ncbi:MAG: G5 domain-containing protein [Chloroflexota bacterium]
MHNIAGLKRHALRKTAWGCLTLLITLLMGCAAVEIDPIVELPSSDAFDLETAKSFVVEIDGESITLESSEGTIRQALIENNIEVQDSDLVTPPLYTPLADGVAIEIVRVAEELETIERGIPFERRIVRNETMAEDDDPIIIQAGQNGLEELTVQIVYHDGLEVERRVVQSVIVSDAQEEILMIGVDITSSAEIVRFGGVLAFVNGGGAQLFRGSNGALEDINTVGILDKRVFSLSPDGEYLLFSTLDESNPDRFNDLFLVPTATGSQPVKLGLSNVLWADWNPVASDPLQIAYSTGMATSFAPGWEAENTVWTVGITNTAIISSSIQQLVDAYPATFGWWGGNYAWSPDGSQIGYSFADEVGVISVPENITEIDISTSISISETEALDLSEVEFEILSNRQSLYQFTEYDTRSDWVWVPNLSWSPDSRYLVFTQHGGEETIADRFETVILDTELGLSGQLLEETGIWSHIIWPSGSEENALLTFLRATNSRDTLSSSYTLWGVDRDGSNARQLFPPVGVSSRFPRDPRFMVWNSVSGRDFIFIFDGDLYWYNLEANEVTQLTNDDAQAALPSWAPYGFAAE